MPMRGENFPKKRNAVNNFKKKQDGWGKETRTRGGWPREQLADTATRETGDKSRKGPKRRPEKENGGQTRSAKRGGVTTTPKRNKEG